MAYHCTRSRARSELDGSDVEPNDVASVAATSSPPGIIVRPSVAPQESPSRCRLSRLGLYPHPVILSQREAFPARADSVC